MMRCLDCGNFHEEVSKRQPHCPTCLGIEDYREDAELELDDPFLDDETDVENLIDVEDELDE